MYSNKFWAAMGKALAVVTVTLIVFLPFAASADAQTFKTLYTFTGGADGSNPSGELPVFDQQGNLYNNTRYGGAYGAGTVFQLTPNLDGTWTESVLYSFTGGSDGGYPILDGLTFDAAGNLYGSANQGGRYGLGVVYKLAPNSDGTWTESVLHQFTGRNDGNSPFGKLIFDTAGNLYGVSGDGKFGCGTVFQLTPGTNGRWTFHVIHQFEHRPACDPWAGLASDTSSNLYGTTRNEWHTGDGCSNPPNDCGTVFKLTPTADGKWTYKVIHKFSGGKGGSDPAVPALIFDDAGALYGTTSRQGRYDSGVLFKLTPGTNDKWSYRVLHQFKRGTDGLYPEGHLVRDPSGTLYGSALTGGTYNHGTVFKLAPNTNGTWTFTVLHAFDGGDGDEPQGGLVRDAAGNLYGETSAGGAYGAGVVFEITP
jgi:uncharacterized repeat protein (TIGR03803 family)